MEKGRGQQGQERVRRVRREQAPPSFVLAVGFSFLENLFDLLTPHQREAE